MTGSSFQASVSKGVTKGSGVEEGSGLGRTIEVDLGLGVREGTSTGELNLVMTALEGSGVGEEGDWVGGTGVASAAQAASRTPSTTFRRRFIRRSIAAKN
jgi:hypothetical protein